MTGAVRRALGDQRGIIAFATATRMTSAMLLGTSLAVYIGERGSPFAVSLALTAFFLGLMLFSPVWGAVADVTGRRRTVLVGSSLLATLALLALLALRGVAGMIGVRGLYAVFAAGFAPVMLSIVSERGGDEGRGRAMGFFNSARAAGLTTGQLVAGVLLGVLAPTRVFLAIAALSLVSTAVLLAVADPIPGPQTEPTLGEVLAEVRARLLPAVEDRAHLHSHGLRWLYVALALRNMTVLGVMSLIAPFLIDRLGLSTVVMGVVLAINPAGQTVFMYLFGEAADAVGRKPLVVGGMAGSGLFGLIAAGAVLPGTPLFRAAAAAGAMVVLGASYSAMTTGALAFIGDVVPAAREGEMMGLRSTAKGVGGVTGPPLVGGIATVASYEAAFAAGAGLAAVAAAVAFVGLTESRPDPAGTPAPGD